MLSELTDRFKISQVNLLQTRKPKFLQSWESFSIAFNGIICHFHHHLSPLEKPIGPFGQFCKIVTDIS